MRSTIDGLGRVVIPKVLRDALGLAPGSEIDISQYGGGVQIQPGPRSGRVETEDGRLVIHGSTVVDDAQLYALIDAGRR